MKKSNAKSLRDKLIKKALGFNLNQLADYANKAVPFTAVIKKISGKDKKLKKVKIDVIMSEDCTVDDIELVSKVIFGRIKKDVYIQIEETKRK